MNTNRFFSITTVVLLSLLAATFWITPKNTSLSEGPMKTISSKKWDILLKGGHTIGPKDAPITLVEFSDFQCPYCGMFEKVLEKYRHDHPGQIRLIMYNYPLRQHPQAVTAAEAAECVAKMGNYARFHNLLFKNQRIFPSQPFDSLAQLAGVKDLTALHGCMRDTTTILAIKHQIEMGNSVDLFQTPTIIINRNYYSGSLSYDELQAAVQLALKSK